MFSNHLATDIELIQSFCQQNGIAPFYGIPEDSGYGPCYWKRASPDALQKYLSALQTVGAKILHLSVQYNEPSPNEMAAIQKAVAALPKQKQKAYSGLVTQLQKDKGAPLKLTATFLYSGVQYAYITHSPLIHVYNNLMSLVDNDTKERGNGLNEPPKGAIPFSNYIAERRTSDKDIAAIARRIATDPVYIGAKHETARRSLAKGRAQEENVRLSSDRIKVAEEAEKIFKSEMEEGRDKERTKRVQALQRKILPDGQKYSLSDIADMLNIPPREMYKYTKA